MSDEELETHKTIVTQIGETIIHAYQERFPDPTIKDVNVIVHSLSATLLSFLMNLDSDIRQKFIDNIICKMIDLRQYG